ncbi:MAG: hypothetical protein K2Y42_08255 [Hyphomicrobium sp.]|jgi:hypothetical protein|uniref:hypothetical protein n=1 Tax=Hyphomicrobium sp. TaxID=82 RepID=UPI0025C66207|nr:hypothetical protein [Hyphomicrobium sp.]MBX9862731.1 hypothetical protein [Hyphomicrobium sp.]
MILDKISTEDLKLISAVLHAAVEDEVCRVHDMPLAIMVRRIHDRILKGERDPAALKAAALGAHVVVPFVLRMCPEQVIKHPKSSA